MRNLLQDSIHVSFTNTKPCCPQIITNTPADFTETLWLEGVSRFPSNR